MKQHKSFSALSRFNSIPVSRAREVAESGVKSSWLIFNPIPIMLVLTSSPRSEFSIKIPAIFLFFT
jgi:hypothetical protein